MIWLLIEILYDMYLEIAVNIILYLREKLV